MTSSLPRELCEWLPVDLAVESVQAWATIARSFDRVNGEALALRVGGELLLLTRPEHFEMFRALPLASRDALRVARGDRGEPYLVVRMSDGRALSLALLESELAQLRGVLDGVAVGSTADPTAERRTISSRPPAEARTTSSRPPAGRDDRGSDRASSIRPPESAEMEIVRIPRSMRSAVGVPSKDGVRVSSSRPPAASTGPSPRPPAPDAAGGTAVGRPGGSPVPPARTDGARPGASSMPPAKSDGARPGAPASGAKTDSVRPPAFAAEPAPIVRSARDTDALRASFRHHFQQGALDEAGQVARALVHLGIADAMERRLAQLQPESPPSFATPLSSYLFRAFLAHDDEDPDLGRVLAAIWPAYLQMRARPDRELGLRPHDEVDLARPPDGLPRLFAHGAHAFSLPMPRLFLRTDVPGGMAHLHAMPIASLCGRTLATAFDAASTLHVLGHHLSLYRPDAYLIALAPAPQELQVLLMTALHLERRVVSDDMRIVSLAEMLSRHMVPPVREALRQACSDLAMVDAPRVTIADALARHRRAVMLTAVRAGFALCGSLAVSDRMQRVMPAVPGIDQSDMLDDLVTFSVSSSWSALRKELGIAVEPSGPNPPIGQRF